MAREVIQEVIFAILQLCVLRHIKKKLDFQAKILMEDELPDDDEM